MCLSVMNDLVLMPVHTKPVGAEKELDELYNVFRDVQHKWGTDVGVTGASLENSTIHGWNRCKVLSFREEHCLFACHVF